ncbi:hypothetical protein OQJ18_00415 [Fluoribacter dumoffii]|uniref:hypothetical protein n=1 Tax=Fluoribacter dumoffii TaxID=463 RepID=UPI002243417C|nr:hypothetical protein [Fluoribacter dumoffii]MCW8419421.1 hypothetical protein [Fluoribacter dumoffii]MCW8452704.1 hypothetical protein [Fluoribacter dumoffii]MCW8460046.1 hypothetical protein [Fluoribacter dumoffii]MCW8483524.1 hypothetical protein [Fluoribacter dumoffii]
MPKNIVPFQVDFAKNGTPVSSRDQAIKILDEVNRLHANGAKKVGITYSANQAQTDKIIDTYQKGGWKTGTNGANQASVVAQIEQLLTTPKYQHLQGVYQTVPITTMQYDSKGNPKPADPSSVKKSLEHASQFMDSGGVLLGWTNQKTPQGSLAIGGGVASAVQTIGQKKMINEWVQDKLPQSTLTDDLPLSPPKKTTSGTTQMQDLQALDNEEMARKKKSVSIQSDEINSLLDAFKKHCGEQWVKDNPPENKNGQLKLSFKSEENMTDFFKQQASEGKSFIMVDEKTQKVMAYSNGDGKIYRPGKDGPQEITGKSLTPKEGEMEDLPKLDSFKMPAKESTQESVSKPQHA